MARIFGFLLGLIESAWGHRLSASARMLPRKPVKHGESAEPEASRKPKTVPSILLWGTDRETAVPFAAVSDFPLRRN